MKLLTIALLLLCIGGKAQDICQGCIYRGTITIGSNDTARHYHFIGYTLPPTYSVCPTKDCPWNTEHQPRIWAKIPQSWQPLSVDTFSNAQQLIIDSLTKKLQLMMEYHQLSCEIISLLELRNRVGYPFVRQLDRMKMVKVVRRYQERYKNIIE